jgi:hypothetical protein
VGGGGDENEDEDAKRLECALCSHVGRKQTAKDCIIASCALCGFVCNAEFPTNVRVAAKGKSDVLRPKFCITHHSQKRIFTDDKSSSTMTYRR